MNTILDKPNLPELAKIDCRFCGTPLKRSFLDLGLSPLCQKHVHKEQLNDPESFYPLHAFVCEECLLVQLGEYVAPEEIFQNYHYFSSYSDSWLAHVEDYTKTMIGRLGLSQCSQVAEIASNDGYLLQFFQKAGIPVYGIEPAANVAAAAQSKGIDTVVAFFGKETACNLRQERGSADLLIGNNVLAHVPDLNDFVSGITELLSPGGVATLEFPHLLKLVAEVQFDTIYHEHFSYFSFTTVERVFASHGLTIFDVDELPTHGGSLRIYARRSNSDLFEVTKAVAALKEKERQAGMLEMSYYENFDLQVERIKRDLLRFLLDAQQAGRVVAAYGAPGKGNTLLNYCGIRTDLVAFTADRNPMKQDTFLPGSRIPVFDPEDLDLVRPDYVLILPWNLRTEITKQLSHIKDWGGRFVTAIPQLSVG